MSNTLLCIHTLNLEIDYRFERMKLDAEFFLNYLVPISAKNNIVVIEMIGSSRPIICCIMKSPTSNDWWHLNLFCIHASLSGKNPS
mmetsp:Transcript_25817/g.60788  ORF Transcript_25817/g.60788 Transcript_25817/m.60788 type:complete len:86 (-) Transcript_25817:729-986(-)